MIYIRKRGSNRERQNLKYASEKRNEPQTDCNGVDADINQIKLELNINGTPKRLSVSTGLLITGKLVKTEIQ